MSFRIQKYLMELFFFFWIFFSISSLFSTFALFLWKKAEYMRASLLTRTTGDGKNWRKWCASHPLSDRRDILAFNHLCVGRFKRTLQFVTVTLWKMNLGSQTHVNFPEKTEVVLKNFINSNKLTNMSGRGKGKSSKKAVSRSAKAGLQFPVGRIARYVVDID